MQILGILAFTDIEIEKLKFHHNKNSILMDDININKILISHKICYKKRHKYCVGYKEDKKVKPCCIMLPKFSLHTRSFDETKWISFLIEDNELLEKDKFSNSIANNLIANLWIMKNI